MRPLRDYLLIERKAAPTKSEGGVDLPDTVEEKPSEGVVLQKGPSVSGEIPIGATVRISTYTGTEIQDNGVVYLLAREKDVLVVVAEPDAA